jgi:hypothetical protein
MLMEEAVRFEATQVSHFADGYGLVCDFGKCRGHVAQTEIFVTPGLSASLKQWRDRVSWNTPRRDHSGAIVVSITRRKQRLDMAHLRGDNSCDFAVAWQPTRPPVGPFRGPEPSTHLVYLRPERPRLPEEE